MTYFCEDCKFLFYRVGETINCPSCGKTNIRTATDDETESLQVVLERQTN